MFYNKVEICGISTASLRVLSEEEKRLLLIRAAAGDREARRELICGNLRLVLSIVSRYAGRRENADDLFQVGCIGLMKAIDNFNVALDVKFSTYAVPMINGEVRRYLRDNSPVRISRGMRDLAYRALTARDALTARLLREPTVDEIAHELGEKRADVSAAMEAIVEPVSLYEAVYNDGDDSVYVIDQLADSESGDEAWVEDVALREAMKKLTPREHKIIEMRFYRGRTQMEIAAEIGISQAQVSRLEKNAIERIRKCF